MRIIHTADWHLCDRLGRIDRTADLQARVETVAGLCREHAADVLVIAGDLFSEQASVEQMTRALGHLRATFADYFDRGGTVLAITGNHDRDARIDLVREGMALAVPSRLAGPLAPGRLYLQNGPAVVALPDRDGDAVQFVLVPYPTVHRYADPADRFRSKEEENRALHARVDAWLRTDALRPPRFDPRLPTVLVAHLHVRGAEVHTLYKLTERDDVVFEPASLPTAWHYAALGHVHKPQEVSGLPQVRYPGSLDRLDFGERDDPRGVLLVDIARGQPVVVPVWLPIKPTPLLDIELTDPLNELSLIEKHYPEREGAIARLRVHPAGVPSRDAVTRELRRLFPRWVDIRWEEDAAPAGGLPAGATGRGDHRATVRGYLQRRLANDPDQDAVLALAEQFLTDGGEA